MKCKDCTVSTEQKVVEADYLLDKYFGKAVTTTLLLLLLSVIVVAQIAQTGVSITSLKLIKTDVVTEECEDVTTLKADKLITHLNGTKEQTYIEVINKECHNVTTYKDHRISADGVKTDYRKQGYECSIVGDSIICDSCIDGNCDGVCDPNGGETCVKIRKTDITHKNSVVSWSGDSGLIPVSELEVKV